MAFLTVRSTPKRFCAELTMHCHPEEFSAAHAYPYAPHFTLRGEADKMHGNEGQWLLNNICRHNDILKMLLGMPANSLPTTSPRRPWFWRKSLPRRCSQDSAAQQTFLADLCMRALC